MASDIHARIQQFLQQRNVTALPIGDGAPSPDDMHKAGVVPFVRFRRGQKAEQGAFLYYLMKPVARHSGLAPPAFQLCKGTRMHHTDAGWRDLREGQAAGRKETLTATALREGIEELGLKLENITLLLELGPYVFSSAKSGALRHMWLFAAEMASPDAFLPAAEVAGTTAERAWLSLAEFGIVGREDHKYILGDIETRLKAYFRQE